MTRSEHNIPRLPPFRFDPFAEPRLDRRFALRLMTESAHQYTASIRLDVINAPQTNSSLKYLRDVDTICQTNCTETAAK